MTDTGTAKRSLRKVAPLAVAGCAVLAGAVSATRRRGRARARTAADPPDAHLAGEQMEALATAEGMPEAPDA